ncbi:UNKNOWN [Stylonychia lemnae]|uniref:Uncharacterized protein n=1 Tax=Stylonychia lemnae TaxID=5949 RepID=A0A077ZXA5_STYLE|nr:UNKNOWN [Stylonychia lemnae]|eukprot:CDW73171.1 UNKNOWN [Stylonychia lemnae]
MQIANFGNLVQPSKSPRYLRSDNLDVSDIKGAKATYEIMKIQTRAHNLDVSDIQNEGKPFKVRQIIDKNQELLRDEIIGKKRLYDKHSSPLNPEYIVRTTSNRKVVIGAIEQNRPRELIKKEVRKDSKRSLRLDDILGAQSKLSDLIPKDKLPNLHPTFMNKDDQQRQLVELRHEYLQRNRESNNMTQSLTYQENQIRQQLNNSIDQGNPKKLKPYDSFIERLNSKSMMTKQNDDLIRVDDGSLIKSKFDVAQNQALLPESKRFKLRVNDYDKIIREEDLVQSRRSNVQKIDVIERVSRRAHSQLKEEPNSLMSLQLLQQNLNQSLKPANDQRNINNPIKRDFTNIITESLSKDEFDLRKDFTSNRNSGGIFDKKRFSNTFDRKELSSVKVPGVQVGKFGGPQFVPANKDYGNFPDVIKIDQLMKNVRHMRQQQMNQGIF